MSRPATFWEEAGAYRRLVERRDGKWGIIDWENWQPSDFFSDSKQLVLCRAISYGSIDDVKEALATDVSLDRPGKFGVTVLYWAYFSDNMEAFELLLEYGADPDDALTDGISTKGVTPAFHPGDSVAISVIKHWHDTDYCLTALKFSDNPNQTDCLGDNLLHIYFAYGRRNSTSFLHDLAKANVDLDHPNRYGTPACHRVLRDSAVQVDMCLTLLKAGADPGVIDEDGNDVADLLESALENRKVSLEDGKELIEWLNKHYRTIHVPKPTGAIDNSESSGANP